MNFALIHSTLQDSVEAAGFKYWEPQDWFNMEIGKLPEAAMQNGFTIRFVNQEPSEHNTDNMGKINMEIEFALQAMRDKYLTRMDNAQTVIRSLRGDLAVAGISNIDDSIWPDFTMQYLGEIVAMTFTINFEVDSN